MRRRLAAKSAPAKRGRHAPGSLRAMTREGAWMKLVNAIEKAGLSLVDTKDEALRSG